MSLSSSHYAEYAESKKEEWADKLRATLDPILTSEERVRKIEDLLLELDNFYFAE